MIIIFIGLIAVALFFTQLYLYRKLWNKELSVTMVFKDETVRSGDFTILTQIVENRKWLPLPALKVKFQCSGYLKFASDKSSQVSDMYYRNDLFSLMPYRRVKRNHRVLCSRRGYYGIRGIDLVGADLFLTQEMVVSRMGETWIYVLPSLLDITDLDSILQKISGEMASRRHLLTDPFSFRGIREYTPFDELKSINWKASAKSDDLKVNIYNYSAVSSVSIFINMKNRQLSGFDEFTERAINIAASLLDYYLTNNVNVSIYANGRDILTGNILFIEENRDRTQLDLINKMLARLDITQEAEPFTIFEERIKQQKERLIIIISPDWLNELQEQLTQIEALQDFVWLLPCRKKEDVKIRESLAGKTLILEAKE